MEEVSLQGNTPGMSTHNPTQTVASFFSRMTLEEIVVLKPRMLDNNYRDYIVKIIKDKYEGICSHNGYIMPGSVEVTDESTGVIRAFTLNGDVEFKVRFTAEVCCPCIGMLVRAKIVNINRLGIMAVVNDAFDHTVLEIIIVKGFDGSKMLSDVDARLNDVQIGHEVDVEVLGKRFHLNDKKISIVGKIVFEDLSVVKKQRSTERVKDKGDKEDDFMVDAGSDDDNVSISGLSNKDSSINDDEEDDAEEDEYSDEDENEDDDDVDDDVPNESGDDKSAFSGDEN